MSSLNFGGHDLESDLYEMSKSGVINESSNILSSTSARGTRKENLEYLASMLSSRRDGKLRQSSGLILDGGDDDPKSRTKAFRFGGVPSAYAPKPAAAPKQHSLGFRKYAPLYDVAVWSDFTVNARLSPPPSLSCPDKKSRLEPRPAIAIRPSARRETGPAARALAPAAETGKSPACGGGSSPRRGTCCSCSAVTEECRVVVRGVRQAHGGIITSHPATTKHRKDKGSCVGKRATAWAPETTSTMHVPQSCLPLQLL